MTGPDVQRKKQAGGVAILAQTILVQAAFRSVPQACHGGAGHLELLIFEHGRFFRGELGWSYAPFSVDEPGVGPRRARRSTCRLCGTDSFSWTPALRAALQRPEEDRRAKAIENTPNTTSIRGAR